MSPRLLEVDRHQLRERFDRAPFLIRHRLTDHPLFALSSLVALSHRLPREQVEYNAGDLTLSQDPDRMPQTELSIEETIERIETCRSWMVLKYVEHDPVYRRLLDDCLDELHAVAPEVTKGMRMRQGFIFVSSPGAVTPFHLDHEHNFLLQVRGTKTVTQYDREDRRLVTDEEIERSYAGAHRNLQLRGPAREDVFELGPGDGLHFPVDAPHHVRNGAAVSISFSVTFRTDASARRAGIYRLNGRLRQLGLHPSRVGQSPLRDQAKWLVSRALRRLL